MDGAFFRGAGAMRRRGFLARLLAGGAAVAAAPVAAGATERAVRGPGTGWLERMTGKHRQFFDAPALADGKALGQVKNYLDAYRDAFGMSPPEVNAVVGIHGSAVPIVFGDGLWAKLELGRRSQVSDPSTKQPAARNPYAATVKELQDRGVVFILCNNSLMRNVRAFSAEGLGTVEAVRAELLAGLLPGVEVVPAHMVAANQAQEAGLSYIYLG